MTPEEHIKAIPVSKRMDYLIAFVTGLNLDHIYSILDKKVETIARSGYRIILGEKPVSRKVHFATYNGPRVYSILCPTPMGMHPKAINRLKHSTEKSEVTCKRCLELLKQKKWNDDWDKTATDQPTNKEKQNES